MKDKTLEGLVKFSSQWWDVFLKTTENMTKTSIFKNCLSEKEIIELKYLILEIIIDLSKLRTVEYGYRVFIDNHKLDENEMDWLYDKPPTKKETIELWCKRVFEDKEFGIIINSAEKFNTQLSKIIALKSKPLLDKLGFPIEGINFTLFIGNYKSTPIGIHQDMPGENVIHYHLGPGKKTMLTWSKEKFEKLEKTHNNKNIEKFIPYAKEFSYEKGDLYFMPQSVYHIGKQKSLSIALTFWFYNHSKKRIIEKLHAVLLEQYVENNDILLPPDKNHINDLSNIDEILSIYNIPKEMNNLNFKELLKEAYRDLRYSISSNAGYRTSPFPRCSFFTMDINKRVIIERPYKILYTESLDKEKLYIYVRGIKFSFNNFNEIKKIIDEINKGVSLSIKEVLKLGSDNWNNEIGIYILSLFYKYHAIKLV